MGSADIADAVVRAERRAIAAEVWSEMIASLEDELGLVRAADLSVANLLRLLGDKLEDGNRWTRSTS